MSRPTKLRADLQESFLDGLKLGLTHKLAAQRAGLGESTYYSWIAKGREAKSGLYREFLDEVMRVEGEAAGELLTQIGQHSKDDWRAAAWILERRHPDDYGKRTELTGKAGGPMQLDSKTEHVFQPTAEVWDEILAKRAAFEALRNEAEENDD